MAHLPNWTHREHHTETHLLVTAEAFVASQSPADAGTTAFLV
jgi:hypothetical protein